MKTMSLRVDRYIGPMLAVALAACGGGAGAPAADVASDKARMRAALEALGHEVGRPVDVQVDAALAGGMPDERVAAFVEELAQRVAERDPRSPRACRASCPALTQLAFAVDARSLWAGLRSVRLRYDVLSREHATHFDGRTGALVFDMPPSGILGASDATDAERIVFRQQLAPRFAGRPPGAIAPPELPAYVFYLTATSGPVEQAGSVAPLVQIYPQLGEPARAVARDALVSARMFVSDDFAPRYGSPAIEGAWALWYRTYAATLDDKSLRDAAYVVFRRERDELPGIRRFDYATALVGAQARGHGTPESAVLACAAYDRCNGPLWEYLVDRRAPERRAQLAGFLLAARDPSLVAFVAQRLFEQRDADEPAFLASLEADPQAWSAAFVPAMFAPHTLAGAALVDAWQRQPAIRAPMLRGLAQVAATPPPPSTPDHPTSRTFGDSPLGHASRALDDLSSRLCAPGTRGALTTLAAQNIPPESPLWSHVRGGRRRLCDG